MSERIPMLIESHQQLANEMKEQRVALQEQGIRFERLAGELKVLNERLSEYPGLKRRVSKLEDRLGRIAAGIAIAATLLTELAKNIISSAEGG